MNRLSAAITPAAEWTDLFRLPAFQGLNIPGGNQPLRQIVMYDHNFNTPVPDRAGFCHLWTPGSASNCGTTHWSNFGGRGHLENNCNFQLGGESMSILRLNNRFGNGRFVLEAEVSLEFMNLNVAYPRFFSFGLDTHNGTNRRFFSMCYRNYDEGAVALDQKWYADMGGGGHTSLSDIGDTQWPWATNENKMLPFLLGLDVNIQTGKFHGFRFGNRIALGSLDPTGATANAMTDLGVVTPEVLAPFEGGINPCFAVTNRTTGTKTKGQMNIHRVRLSYMKGL